MHVAQLDSFFFFNDTATTEIYPLSLHDALPIYLERAPDRIDDLLDRLLHRLADFARVHAHDLGNAGDQVPDRKSTRLNSSHSQISYAVFCLKKKKTLPPDQEHLTLCYNRTDQSV